MIPTWERINWELICHSSSRLHSWKSKWQAGCFGAQMDCRPRRLQLYVNYKPGKLNCDADALSSCPIEVHSSSVNALLNQGDFTAELLTINADRSGETTGLPSVTGREMEWGAAGDPVLNEVIKLVKTGNKLTKEECVSWMSGPDSMCMKMSSTARRWTKMETSAGNCYALCSFAKSCVNSYRMTWVI